MGGYDTALLDAGDMIDGHYDCVIVSLWLNALSPALSERFISLSPREVDSEEDRIISYIESVVSKITERTSAPILINNFPVQSRPSLGIVGHDEMSSLIRLNARVLEMSRRYRTVYVVDYFGIMALVGGSGFDPNKWESSKSPLSPSGLVAIGREYGAFFRAMRGMSKKCLVLDCDNTLWSGILGEEGAHVEGRDVAFQKYLLNLHERGVLIALCSKNNESDVIDFLRGSQDMLLRESHLATWQINWKDKPTNLRKIASDLNIGIDSLVFVDDSPFEREMVKSSLPEATVVADHDTRSLDGLFDSLTFSDEDKRKTSMYQADRERTKLSQTFSSVEDYLNSLNMVMSIRDATLQDAPRVSQLTQKTNQFNLTTRRYTEGQIESFIGSGNGRILCVRMRDNISDLGVVGVVMVATDEGSAEIDEFLLSCRALGRGVEDAMLSYIIEWCKKSDITHLYGRYIPTKKNSQVSRFYEDRGFEPDGNKVLIHPGRSYISFPKWISLE